MTPKHNNKPRGLFAAIAAMVTGAGGNSVAVSPHKEVYKPPPSMPTFRASSDGSPHFRQMSQPKRRKINRRSGVNLKRRAKV